MIEVRKLAAVDMLWLGPRLIIPEYAAGVILPLVLGALTLRALLAYPNPPIWQIALGVWLVGIAANYFPLFLYAVAIARSGTVKIEGEPELPHARRYGAQQVILLVPLLVMVLALVQERAKRKRVS